MLRKRGWGRVPLLLSMGNAGECARMKRRAQASRVSASRERTSEGRRLRHAEEKEGTGGRVNVRTHERTYENERTEEEWRNEGTKERRKRHKVTKQAGEPRYGMRLCSPLACTQRQPRQAEAVLVLVVIVGSYTLSSVPCCLCRSRRARRHVYRVERNSWCGQEESLA